MIQMTGGTTSRSTKSGARLAAKWSFNVFLAVLIAGACVIAVALSDLFASRPANEVRFYRDIDPVAGTLNVEIKRPQPGSIDWSLPFYEGTYDSRGRLIRVRKFIQEQQVNELVLTYDNGNRVHGSWHHLSNEAGVPR